MATLSTFVSALPTSILMVQRIPMPQSRDDTYSDTSVIPSEGGAGLVQQQGLTPREVLYAQDQLSKEQLCLKKCSIYSNQIQDPQLKGSVQRMIESCQRHVNALSGLVGQSGQMPMQ